MNYTNDDYDRELTESETMDGLISSIVGGIKKRVKAKRERKKAQSNLNHQVSTPSGVTNLSPQGTFNYTQQGQQSNDILKNPVVLAGLIGIPLLLILLAKRS